MKSAKQMFMVSNFLCLAALWNWALFMYLKPYPHSVIDTLPNATTHIKCDACRVQQDPPINKNIKIFRSLLTSITSNGQFCCVRGIGNFLHYGEPTRLGEVYDHAGQRWILIEIPEMRCHFHRLSLLYFLRQFFLNGGGKNNINICLGKFSA